jgi:ubiquitin-protein ligase
MRRIFKEVSMLSASLPASDGSSICVRVDEDRPEMMKALIIGPAGTPYENGAFEFDVWLPPSYPDKPPRIKLATTGGGRVRFNPNLYASGKVCLSLLGTWRGPGWDAKNGTLLQVLVSIQALIMVDRPYFNEPGYEAESSTAAGRAKSALYNRNVREATLRHAVADALRAPPPAFADVVKFHFRSRRLALRAQSERWLKDARRAARGDPSVRRFLIAEGGVLSSPRSLERAVEMVQAGFERMFPRRAAEGEAALSAAQRSRRRRREGAAGGGRTEGSDDEVRIVGVSRAERGPDAGRADASSGDASSGDAAATGADGVVDLT